MTTGQCANGHRCKFSHVLTQPVVHSAVEDGIVRHTQVIGAHRNAITAMAMTEEGIYTVSQDQCLKRWKPTRRGDSRFELHAEIETPLQESAHSLLYHNGWIFIGLHDGRIRAFFQDGQSTTLKGHDRRVTALVMHQDVLISGSSHSEVRLWQKDQLNSFKCTHTITESIPGAVVKLHVLGDHLFVGGVSGVAMCNLGSLKVTKLLPPTKHVTAFLEYQGHLIIAYLDGALHIFDADGNSKSELKPLKAGPILCLAGLESGPRVLVGHARGQISTITLPEFEFKTQFQAIEGTKVVCMLCAGHDGIFLIGYQNGTLHLWQRTG